jgi:tRNA (mo5U34)-methyltransferase
MKKACFGSGALRYHIVITMQKDWRIQVDEKRESLLRQVRAHEWVYDFDLGHGEKIQSRLPESVRSIVETRSRMVFPEIKKYFGDELSAVRCLDIGCHEGFMSFETAQIVKSVKGIDVRKESLEKAELIRQLKGIENVTFGHGDCYKLDEYFNDPFDLTLFVGVLYHLYDPIGALRNVSRVTKKLCVIETQVIEDTGGVAEWGSKDWLRDYKGTFALIDETAEFDSGNPEAGSYGLSLCPSISALLFMLQAVGFKAINIVPAPSGGYEQYVRGKRVVILASKTCQ